MSFSRQTGVRTAAVAPSHPAPSRAADSAPLDAPTLHTMQSRLGTDFSSVRVHTDAQASQAATALGAKAFAVGEDVAFAPGRYRPHTTEGTRLIAHELAHVAQQRQGGAASPAQAEAKARDAADRVAQGRAVSPSALGGAPAGVYCEPEEDEGVEKAPSADLTLKTLPPIDFLKQRSTYDSHGRRMGMRDIGDMASEWERRSEMLDLLGIDDRFKLGFITKRWLLNKGLSMQLDDEFSRENPNTWERVNRRWRNDTGAVETPIIPIYTKDFPAKKKKVNLRKRRP